MNDSRHPQAALAFILALACSFATDARADAPSQPEVAAGKSGDAPKLDRSGKPRKGEASYYGQEFAGKTMANGKPMNPDSNTAASKTLPLGTEAKVTNLENGKSATVEIRDRGPYVDGRIIDVTPKVAKQLEMKKEGVAPVVVKPVDLPPKDGQSGGR